MFKKIESFEELIYFIETTNLKEHQIDSLIQQTINVYIDIRLSKTELLKELTIFWSKWGNKPVSERPLFLTEL